jgi:hypothetical protein
MRYAPLTVSFNFSNTVCIETTVTPSPKINTTYYNDDFDENLSFKFPGTSIY